MAFSGKLMVIIILGIMMGGLVVWGVQPATFTDGEEYWFQGYIGRVINSDTHYATSWISNEDSEDITAKGYLKWYDIFTLYTPIEYRYIAELEGVLVAETEWFPFEYFLPDYNVWLPLESWTFNVKGELIGRLTITLEFYLDAWFLPDYHGPMGWDGSYLESGRGEIFVYGGQETFEEGEEAPIYVRTGFTNGAGWTVKLYAPLTRPGLFSPNPRIIAEPGDDWQGIVNILIEEGWFTIGTHVDNTFTVELWNKFFNVGFTQIFSVDMHERQPGQPIMSASWAGNTATITAMSEVTYKEINLFVVWAWYGDNTMPSVSDGESWILFAEEYSVTNTSGNVTVIFTVQAKNKDGNIRIKCLSSDIEGRVSEPGYLSLVVENGLFDRTIDIGQPFIFGIIVWVLLFIGAILGIIAAYLAYLNTTSWLVAIFAFVIIFGSFAVIAWVAGAIPSIATSLGLWIGGV